MHSAKDSSVISSTRYHSSICESSARTFLSISTLKEIIIAFSLKQVCYEIGLRIPEDLSIIGFNNSMVAKMSSPPLTSIDINSFQLGIEAASQIINHIENPNLMATKIIVPHQLVERESCKKI